MENIEYKLGWKKKFKYIWDNVKLISMDFSGWDYITREKKSKLHNFKDYMSASCFRNVACKEGLGHVVGDIYYDGELKDGSWETSNNFNKLIGAIDKMMKARSLLFIQLGSETHNLEERTDLEVVKIFKLNSEVTRNSPQP